MTPLSLSLIFACLCITKSLLMSIRKEGLFEGQRYKYSYKSEIQYGKPGVMALLNNFALPFHFFAKGTHYKSETTKK